MTRLSDEGDESLSVIRQIRLARGLNFAFTDRGQNQTHNGAHCRSSSGLSSGAIIELQGSGIFRSPGTGNIPSRIDQCITAEVSQSKGRENVEKAGPKD